MIPGDKICTGLFEVARIGNGSLEVSRIVEGLFELTRIGTGSFEVDTVCTAVNPTQSSFDTGSTEPSGYASKQFSNT